MAKAHDSTAERAFSADAASVRARAQRAARRLIGVNGVERVGVREIAAESGLAVSTLYAHFEGGKEEILISAVGDRLIEVCAFRAEPLSGGVAGELLAWLDAWAEETLGSAAFYKELNRWVNSHSPAARGVARAIRKPPLVRISESLEGMKRAGELAPWAEPRSLARQLSYMTTGLWQSWCLGGISDEDYKRECALGYALLLLSVSRGAAQKYTEILCRDLIAAAPEGR